MGAAIHDVDADRARLRSRRRQAALQSSNPLFMTPAEMRAWLESDEISVHERGGWPTPDTAALWAAVRTEALRRGIRSSTISAAAGLFRPLGANVRPVSDRRRRRRWTDLALDTDYTRLAALRKPAIDPKPSLFSVDCPNILGERPADWTQEKSWARADG